VLGHENWSGTGLMGSRGVHFLRRMITADKLERAKIFMPARQLGHSLMNPRLASVAGVPLSSVFRSSPQLQHRAFCIQRVPCLDACRPFPGASTLE
jgi:hypothetical protein